jgi:hypothetical protein
VNTIMNLRVRYNVGKFLCRCTTSGFSRRPQLQEVSQSVNVYLFIIYLWSLVTLSTLPHLWFLTMQLMLILVYLMTSIHVQFTQGHFLIYHDLYNVVVSIYSWFI